MLNEETPNPPVEGQSAEESTIQNPPVRETAPSIREELASLHSSTIVEQQQMIMKLQRDLAEKNATPAIIKDDDPATFLNAPRTAVRDEINTALKEQVAPLLEFVQETRRGQAYTALVQRLKRSAPALHALYEENADYIDQMMGNQEATPQNIQAVILMAKGAASLNTPHIPVPVAAAATPPVREPVIPPNLQPSPPTPPRKSSGKDPIEAAVEALTESQRKAAKFAGFTDLKEYVQFLNADTDMSSWPVKGA